MADKITVSPEELSACAAAYLKASRKLNEATATYNQALQKLSSDWTGKAFQIMSGKVAQMVKNIGESYTKCYDAVSELTNVKTLFEENEQSVKSTFTSLETGSSPFNA